MPNSDASQAVVEVDFVTALGRLLQSGALRDAFASDPQALAQLFGVRESDRALFMHLAPAELEVQAVLLLRKRFDLVRRAVPRTCEALARNAWNTFHIYSRVNWPSGANQVAEDAFGFCGHVLLTRPDLLCQIEYHRMRFARGSDRWAISFVTTVPFRRGFRRGLQVFFRRQPNRWHEWMVFVGL